MEVGHNMSTALVNYTTVPSKDSDQPVHLHSLTRVFDGYSMSFVSSFQSRDLLSQKTPLFTMLSSLSQLIVCL